MKEKIRKTEEFIIVYVVLTAIFLLGIILSYLLPNDQIRIHVKESLLTFLSEGSNTYYGTTASTLDYFTDALMLNIAMNNGTKNNVENAVENSYYADEKKGGILSLAKAAMDETANNSEYSRYWHGIQVFLRPLLMFFNYSEIRYILMIVIFVLLGIVLTMIGEQIGMKIAIAFAISISFMYITLIPASLQYSSIFIVTLISMIGVMTLYKINKEKYISIAFFIIGALATYFDLLTYPLVTLGFPLILAVILENKREKNLKEQMIFIIKLGIIWAIGYALLFFTKWMIASIVLRKNAISLDLKQLLFRINGNEQYPVTRLQALFKNFEYFFVPIAKKTCILITLVWIILMIFYRKEIKECNLIVPLLFISITPYIWYIAFSGHSDIHSWFTNKSQAVTVFAVLSIFAETLDFRNNRGVLKWKE